MVLSGIETLSAISLTERVDSASAKANNMSKARANVCVPFPMLPPTHASKCFTSHKMVSSSTRRIILSKSAFT